MARSIVVLALAAICGQSAQDPAVPPAEEYKTRMARLNEALADEHYKVGDYCASVSMFRWARDEFRKSIGFNPEHEGSRAKLGYVKKDGEWEPNPDAALDTENKKKAEEEAKARMEYDKRVEKLGKTIARLFTDVGNFCDKNKMKPEAEAAFKKAIEYDPLNSDSRKKLGYTRPAKDGPWLSQFDIKFRKELKDGVAKAVAGAAHKAATEVEQDMGWKHEKRSSSHFLIEVPGQSQEWLALEMKHGEHAYAMFHKLFNQKEDLFQQPFNMVILKDKSSHEAYVDKYYGGSDAAWKTLAKKSQGVGGFPRSETTLGDRPDVHDWMVHHTVEDLFSHLVGGARPWLREGMAYHFTRAMLGTAGTSCTNMAGTGSGGEKNLQNAEDWPLVLRTWIKEGKDPSILEVFKCKELANLSGSETVKGWSMVDFLLTEYREKTIEFFMKIRGQKEEDDEIALKEVFGWTLEDFDSRWRTYARASY